LTSFFLRKRRYITRSKAMQETGMTTPMAAFAPVDRPSACTGVDVAADAAEDVAVELEAEAKLFPVVGVPPLSILAAASYG
jgi:hypothetical protein